MKILERYFKFLNIISSLQRQILCYLSRDVGGVYFAGFDVMFLYVLILFVYIVIMNFLYVFLLSFLNVTS
jgi:hypothetical protein